VKEWTHTLPSGLPFWELEFRWTLEFSEGNCKGQNSLDWRVPYIITKILEHRCLNWAYMTHLSENINYGQKKCRDSSFGLAIKAKGLQGCRPKWSLGIKAKRSQGCGPRRSPRMISHTSGSVRKCEGIWGSEPSHSQGNSHFGRWSPDGLPKL